MLTIKPYLPSVYLDMGAVGTSPTSNAYIEFKLDSTNWASYARLVDELYLFLTLYIGMWCRKWNVMASQIECDKNYHAPHVSSAEESKMTHP